MQAQGLAKVFGSLDIVQAVRKHDVVLAAHEPDTAEGAGRVLGCKMDCVSQSFASCAGLVVALGRRLSARDARSVT